MFLTKKRLFCQIARDIVLEKDFPEYEQGQRDTSNRERVGIGFVQVLQEIAAVRPEIAVSAVDAKQLGQLRTGKEQGHATLKPDHHAFGDEVDDRARLEQPGDKGNESREKGRARGQCAEPARVAARDSAERRADEQ